MGGGLMQLVAYGAQDIYLTGNPQITFFKVVYRRHTNFSMEAIEQTWNGNSNGTSGRCTATISRNGDLVHKMYLEIKGTTNDYSNPIAQAITSVELEIGGQKIDKQTGQWMETWVELTEPNPTGHMGVVHVDGAATATSFQKMSGLGGLAGTDGRDLASPYFVPLMFWFCRNPGLALPLIALQYHEVKVILEHVLGTVLDTNVTNKLWCDYIYLDTDERRRFAQVSHEYLIEQVQEQTTSATSGSASLDLNFNHPVKELIWVPSTIVAAEWNGGGAAADIAAGTYLLKLNGHDRFAARDFSYFTRVQVQDYHSGPGGLGASTMASGQGQQNDSIAVYSFALKPEEHQPSGTCNFSRIDNAQLVVSSATGPFVIYAVNYNVLRIMSGMGGLAYSN
jgi:hypothetical protein